MNLISLVDLDICYNHLYETDFDLWTFLDNLQPGWEDCQKIGIDECDSGVENRVLSDGRTILALIEECADGAKNRGGFVSCVSKLTNELKREGMITGEEKDAVQSCAAQADIP